MSHRHRRLKRLRYLKAKNQCQHIHRSRRRESRCTETGIECFFEGETEYFCPAHAHTHGFCIGCGQFWAGVGDFDVRPSKLCDHCQHEAEADAAGFDENDPNYFDFDYAEQYQDIP